nr:MAG TPA: hypothetical protein [Caudoviricetes sp.]
MANNDMSRMDSVCGNFGAWDKVKDKVKTKVYASDVQYSLYECLDALGKAFDDVTINPNPPSYGTTAKLGTARLGSMKLGQE